MIKKLNSMPDFQARMPKQPHDLSRHYGMTFSTGMITCPYSTMVHTGDTLHFNGAVSARFNPLILPFLGHVDIHMDYFFVPLSVMYTPSPSLFYQTDDIITSLVNREELQKQYFPRIDVDGSISQIMQRYDSPNDSIHISYSSSNQYILYNHSFDCVGKSIVRMCDWFGINPLHVFGVTQSVNPTLPYWRLLAYHACYNLYPGFRNFDREPKDYSYNIDSHYRDSAAFLASESLFYPHYIDLDKDYFNAIKVSPIASSVSMLPSSSGVFNANLFKAVNNYLDTGSYGLSDNIRDINYVSDDSLKTQVAGNPNVSGYHGTQVVTNHMISTQQIRVMFAFEKLLRVIGRAEKTYEAQFLAHFGVKIPHDVMHNITHIGHDVCSLSTQQIIATANTFNPETGEGSSLGDFGGNGQVSFKGKKRTFKVPTHGVFLCMMYAKPSFYYQTVLSRIDDVAQPMKFWQPEYDRLGMQPLFAYEAAGGLEDADVYNNNSRIGWQFGYEHFKRSYNRISLAFRNPVDRGNEGYYNLVNSYTPWFLSKIPYCNVLGQWLNAPAPEQGVTTTGSIGWQSFKSSPTDLNNVMVKSYETTWIEDLDYAHIHELFYSDPLIADFGIDMKDVNFMSEYGEPEL